MKNIFGRIWAVWGLLWFIITMLIFMIPFIIIYYRPEPRRTHNFIFLSRIWMGIYMPLIGCPVLTRGRKNFASGQNYIVLFNHNAFIDVPVSSPCTPGGNKTIAKTELASTPVFGMLYKMGSVLVDRNSEASRRESFSSMKQVLDMGLHMIIYPEGTRNRTTEPLKAFHNGAFRLAVATGKPIMPAIIFNSRKVMPPKPPFFLWPCPMRLHFLSPVAIDPADTVEGLKEKLFVLMSDYYQTNA